MLDEPAAREQRIQKAAADVAWFIDKIAKSSCYTTRRQLDPYVVGAAEALLRMLEATGAA